MQWDLLRSFEAVARLGSLTAASRALGVSQSTISRQLARLEEDARSPLLLRESPVRLTERGEALLAAVAPMLDAARAAEVALELGTPPIVNPVREAAWARQAATAVLGERAVVPFGITNMGGEDFAFYLERTPGSFLLFGQGKWHPALRHFFEFHK